MKTLSVVMVTMNEEKSVANVIGDIKKYAPENSEIIIVDSSQDRTGEIAKSLGARVIRQEPSGYGQAMILGLKQAGGDIIITTDCDGTYPMEDIPEFIRLINEGNDIVSGNRLNKKNKAMPLINRFGNWFFAAMTRALYGIKTKDVTTGMRAYTKAVINSEKWETNYALPVELAVRPFKKGFKYKEVDIDYIGRIGATKLNKWRSGKAIINCLLKYC